MSIIKINSSRSYQKQSQYGNSKTWALGNLESRKTPLGFAAIIVIKVLISRCLQKHHTNLTHKTLGIQFPPNFKAIIYIKDMLTAYHVNFLIIKNLTHKIAVSFIKFNKRGCKYKIRYILLNDKKRSKNLVPKLIARRTLRLSSRTPRKPFNVFFGTVNSKLIQLIVIYKIGT